MALDWTEDLKAGKPGEIPYASSPQIRPGVVGGRRLRQRPAYSRYLHRGGERMAIPPERRRLDRLA